MDAQQQHVKVVLRPRPMSATEKTRDKVAVQCISDKLVEVGYNSAGKFTKKQFSFDAVFDEKTTQKEFYDEAVSNVVDEVLQVGLISNLISGQKLLILSYRDTIVLCLPTAKQVRPNLVCIRPNLD